MFLPGHRTIDGRLSVMIPFRVEGFFAVSLI